jgi:hypothetical protein
LSGFGALQQITDIIKMKGWRVISFLVIIEGGSIPVVSTVRNHFCCLFSIFL